MGGPHVRGGRGRLGRGEVDGPPVGDALARGERGGARHARLSRGSALAAAHESRSGAGRAGRADLRTASPHRLESQAAGDEPDISRPHSTIHQVLRRGGCSRRPRPKRPAVVRYEWPCPGNLLHMDVKKLGRFETPGHALTADRTRRSRGAGWDYVHSIVDDCSRLAYSEIHPDERAATVTAFTRRALDWLLEQGIVAERLMTDNASPTSTTARCASCSGGGRSATSAPGPTRPGPTARSSASTRPSSTSGPPRSNTPQAKPGERRCLTGSTTTTSAAPTPRSATGHPATRSGRPRARQLAQQRSSGSPNSASSA